MICETQLSGDGRFLGSLPMLRANLRPYAHPICRFSSSSNFGSQTIDLIFIHWKGRSTKKIILMKITMIIGIYANHSSLLG